MPTKSSSDMIDAFLAADEPPAFEVINATGSNSIVLVCDHASNRIPRSLSQLGLSDEQLDSHIAWDAGVATVAKLLAQHLDAALVLSGYSRLVIDCNRIPGSDGSIVKISDGVVIPGNQNLDSARKSLRQQVLFAPYQQAIHKLLEYRDAGKVVLAGLHSFNPTLNGKHRPWHIGVCYGADRRLADRFLKVLPAFVSGEIGDNQPYQIDANVDYTLPHHAGSRKLQHVMLEIRRDEIGTIEQASHWAQCLARSWQALA